MGRSPRKPSKGVTFSQVHAWNGPPMTASYSDAAIPATQRLYPPPQIISSSSSNSSSSKNASKPPPPPPTQLQQQQRQQRWELRQQEWQQKQRALQKQSLQKQQSFRLHKEFQRRYEMQLQQPALRDPLGPSHKSSATRISAPEPASPRSNSPASRNRFTRAPTPIPTHPSTTSPASYLHNLSLPSNPDKSALRPLFPASNEAARPTYNHIPSYSHPLANGVARQVDWLPPDQRTPSKQKPPNAAAVLGALIADARKYHQLQAIVLETSSYFNIRHTCAILSKLVFFQKTDDLSVRDVRLMATTMMPILVDRIKSASVEFDGRSISTIVYSFGKLGVDDRDLVTQLTGVVEPWLETLTTQGLSIMMWGLCKADLTPEAAWMDRYFACVLRSLPDFKPEELSTVMWSVAKLGYKAAPSVMSDLLFHVQSSFHLYSNQSLSNVVYSLGLSAHAPSTAWLEAMHVQLCKKANSFTPQGITQVYWALAKLDLIPTAAQLAPLVRHARSHLESDYKAIDCSTLLYVFARFRTPPPPALLSRLMLHMPPLLPEMEPCQLANSIWALGSLRLDFPHAAGAVWYEMFWSSSFRHLHLFGPTDLAQTLWGCARLRLLPPSRWINAVKERVELQSVKFSPTEVTETVWALARLGCPVSTELLNKLFSSSENRLSSFKPKELSSIIWALAHVNRAPDAKWAEEFTKATFHKMAMFEPQGLGNMLLALSKLRLRPPPAWLYHYVKVSRAALPTLDALTLGQMIVALRRLCDGMPLQKVDDFILDALDALAGLEMESRAYTTTQLGHFLELAPHPSRLYASRLERNAELRPQARTDLVNPLLLASSSGEFSSEMLLAVGASSMADSDALVGHGGVAFEAEVGSLSIVGEVRAALSRSRDQVLAGVSRESLSDSSGWEKELLDSVRKARLSRGRAGNSSGGDSSSSRGGGGRQSETTSNSRNGSSNSINGNGSSSSRSASEPHDTRYSGLAAGSAGGNGNGFSSHAHSQATSINSSLHSAYDVTHSGTSYQHHTGPSEQSPAHQHQDSATTNGSPTSLQSPMKSNLPEHAQPTGSHSLSAVNMDSSSHSSSSSTKPNGVDGPQISTAAQALSLLLPKKMLSSPLSSSDNKPAHASEPDLTDTQPTPASSVADETTRSSRPMGRVAGVRVRAVRDNTSRRVSSRINTTPDVAGSSLAEAQELSAISSTMRKHAAAGQDETQTDSAASPKQNHAPTIQARQDRAQRQARLREAVLEMGSANRSSRLSGKGGVVSVSAYD